MCCKQSNSAANGYSSSAAGGGYGGIGHNNIAAKGYDGSNDNNIGAVGYDRGVGSNSGVMTDEGYAQDISRGEYGIVETPSNGNYGRLRYHQPFLNGRALKRNSERRVQIVKNNELIKMNDHFPVGIEVGVEVPGSLNENSREFGEFKLDYDKNMMTRFGEKNSENTKESTNYVDDTDILEDGNQQGQMKKEIKKVPFGKSNYTLFFKTMKSVLTFKKIIFENKLRGILNYY